MSDIQLQMLADQLRDVRIQISSSKLSLEYLKREEERLINEITKERAKNNKGENAK